MIPIIFGTILVTSVVIIIFLLLKDWVLPMRDQINSKGEAQTDNIDEANTIVRTAKSKADKIVREAKFFSRDVEQDLKQGLTDTAEEVTYDARERMRDIATHMQAVMEDHVKDFSAQLKADISSLNKDLSARKNNEYKAIKDEIIAYRKQRIAEVNEKISVVIPNIVRDVTRKSIPLHEHEKLVMEALDKLALEEWPGNK